jgi:hypothetical protein
MLRFLFASSLTILFALTVLPSIAQQSVLLTNSPLIGAAAETIEHKANDSTSTSSVVVPVTLDNALVLAGTEWKQWNVVENFAFEKDRGTLTMIADVNALHPYFRDRIRQLIADCKAKGIELAIVESFRTHAKQNEYRGMGKAYTNSTGGKSKHQYGLAVDVVPMVNNKPVWDNRALWLKVGATGEKLGLRWGGRWKSPYDPAHFEWAGGLTAVNLAAGQSPLVPQEEYPCIDEDLATLRMYWKEWEVQQSAETRR